MSVKNWVINDFVSKSHAQHLKASLFSYFNVQKPLENRVPNGYHLIYFNPKHEENSLSKDGYDSHQQPSDDSFKRRLWVGGEIQFKKPLKFHEQSFCVEEFERVRKLKDSTIVTLNREILQNDEIALVEKRSLIYTNQLYNATQIKHKTNEVEAHYRHVLKPTDLLNFRYSALTFNAHRIHWDKEYLQKEGYPNLLVQGPLTITLLLEWFSTLFNEFDIKSFKYKNHSPIFVNETIELALNQVNGNEFFVWIQGADKQIHVSGTLNV